MLRSFAVSQQAQTSFKGRLKRPKQGLAVETSTAPVPAWGRGRPECAGHVAWVRAQEKRGKGGGEGCACAVAGSRLVRRPAQPRMEGWSRPKTWRRFPTQKIITTGGSIPCTQHRYFREVPKFMSIESVMPSNHLILCHPLLLLPSIFPSIRVFSNHALEKEMATHSSVLA